MLTIEDIRKSEGLDGIPNLANRGVILDMKLFEAMKSDDLCNKYNKYDFDVHLKDFDRDLQRPYVWEQWQKNEFIRNLLLEKPLERVIVVLHQTADGPNRMQVIDGKQRLLTIHKFLHSEFPITVGGKECWWDDFGEGLGNFFRSRVNSITADMYFSDDMLPVTDRQKILLFNYYNFSGTPQTENHKKMLQKLLLFENK